MQVDILSRLNIAFKVYLKMNEQLWGSGVAQYLDLTAMTSLVPPPANFMGLGGAGCDQHLWTCGTPNLFSTVRGY